jgi:hypothetical protein
MPGFAIVAERHNRETIELKEVSAAVYASADA